MRVENNQTIDIFFGGAGVSISNEVGNLMFFSDGFEIRNSQDQQLRNGDLSEGATSSQRIQTQSNLFLPLQQTTGTTYCMLQTSYGATETLFGERIVYYDLDQNFNGGQGRISRQWNLNIADSLTTGELTACRHANGRDWWVLLAEAEKPVLYSILVSPDTAKVVDTLETSYPMLDGVGQAIFTLDGTKYIRLNMKYFDEDHLLDIFDFNRCTGTVSNHRQFSVGTDAAAGGVSISPSSQYMYVSHYNYIYQYDLWADDIESNKDTVAIYDGYREWGFFTGRFFLAHLAPDGKIYLNSTSGIKKLHRIEYPDRAGEACEVRQHSIGLPNSNAFTLANHPNYRLGPLDGSPCDTLGLDNVPRAYYRIDRDTLDTLAFRFHDLSFYEPATWAWTFGDGASSTERYPAHTYAGPGHYEVCLTVTNVYGQDTHCRTLELGTVAAKEPTVLPVKLFPNPVRDILVFDLGNYVPLRGQWLLYDAAGRLVRREAVWASQARFDLTGIAGGVYFYEFHDAGRRLAGGKVVKME